MSDFLFDKINSAKELGMIGEVPQYIINGLSENIKLRDYQIDALENFLIYAEGPLSKNKQVWNLFHMATGSGKTVMMAAMILYYFKQGYRNFVFFVKNINIIDKTIENLTNPNSSKYLFSKSLEIEGKRIKINKVDNFQHSDKDAINICFTSNAGLQNALGLLPRENSLSINDFEDEKVVMLADESHHINASTKKGEIFFEDEEDRSWENTTLAAFRANKDNVLLEFTATADLKNPYVSSKYKDVIVFDYPLSKFREDKYSKEIMSLPSTDDIMERAILSLVLSQYRYKLFLSIGYNIKPIVMFKSKSIAASSEFYEEFSMFLKNNLNVNYLETIKSKNSQSKIIQDAFDYYSKDGLNLNLLVSELKLEFSEERSILVNSSSNRISQEDAVLLNSLEEPNNPYRLIFVVNMLNEGWDVLNLFDIVRLYNERQGAHGRSERVSKYTISEAQLIGRGARYCPFKIEDWQEENKRKYDHDLDNPLRVAETLIYHCMTDNRYIAEIRTALKEIGLVADEEIKRIDINLKDSFTSEKFYKTGFIYTNKKVERSRNEIIELPTKFRAVPVEHTINVSAKDWVSLFGNESLIEGKKIIKSLTVQDLPNNILFSGIRRFPVLNFDNLIRKFPNIKSTKEFLLDSKYLGKMIINIKYPEDYLLTNNDLFDAYNKLLNVVSDYVSKIKISYEGTMEFHEEPIQKYITNLNLYRKTSNVPNGGEGYSQNHYSVHDKYRLDLSNEDWYVYEDNYGTTEEKSFVKYFSTIISKFKEKYDKVFLIRNERKIGIYSFDSGDRFEPDYILFLGSGEPGKGSVYYQIFVEPKGDHLLENDKWKENFLLEISKNNIEYELFMDGTKYKIWGLPFYNEKYKLEEFSDSINKFMKD